MSKYEIELDEAVDMYIREKAEKFNMSIESFIEQILHRYADLPHTIQTEEVENGYTEMGDINLDWANLK